jgi:putative heme-binding domain-containing protein
MLLPILVLACAPAFAADPGTMPEQAARGKVIFVDATKKTQCATCHQLGKDGTAVGPDLTQIARISPKALVISILSTRTVHAKEVQLKIGRKFPAMIAKETDADLKMYDLSKVPPEEMVLPKTAVHAVRDNGTWKHPPESTGYSMEQLADVIAYVRWVAYGDTKGVNAAELK